LHYSKDFPKPAKIAKNTILNPEDYRKS